MSKRDRRSGLTVDYAMDKRRSQTAIDYTVPTRVMPVKIVTTYHYPDGSTRTLDESWPPKNDIDLRDVVRGVPWSKA